MSDNTDFVAEARQKCAMSIRNTAVGDWLGDALRRLEEADAENERLREEQASEPSKVVENGMLLDVPELFVVEGPEGLATAQLHFTGHEASWIVRTRIATGMNSHQFSDFDKAVSKAKELAGIKPEPEGPGPVPDWFASGCKKAGYELPVEQHWAGYIGDLCREAMRQKRGAE